MLKFNDSLTKFKVCEANLAHALDLVNHLSEMDAYELTTASGVSPYEAMKRGVFMTTAYALVDKKSGIVYSLGGVGQGGTIWMVCSRYIDHQSKSVRSEIFKASKCLLQELLNEQDTLTNFMLAKNKSHRRFIEALGGQFLETTATINGEEFIQFVFNKQTTKEV